MTFYKVDQLFVCGFYWATNVNDLFNNNDNDTQYLSIAGSLHESSHLFLTIPYAKVLLFSSFPFYRGEIS
jgi:hypothetical protein